MALFIYVLVSGSYINGVHLRGTFTSVKRGTKGVQKYVCMVLYKHGNMQINATFDKKNRLNR